MSLKGQQKKRDKNEGKKKKRTEEQREKRKTKEKRETNWKGEMAENCPYLMITINMNPQIQSAQQTLSTKKRKEKTWKKTTLRHMNQIAYLVRTS